MKQEKIFFENEGEKIATVLHTPDQETKKAVILAHGFTGNKDTECGSDMFPSLAENLRKKTSPFYVLTSEDPEKVTGNSKI